MIFSIKDLLHNKARALLHLETAPGLGCTEPAAIGLCAASAAALLSSRDFERIEVTLDPNLYKNARGVIIPGTEGGSGLPLAAALGAAVGDATLKLQVFARVDPQGLAKARELVRAGKVTVGLSKGQNGLYVKTVVTAAGHTAAAVIAGQHDHIVSLVLDGTPRDNHPLLSRAGAQAEDLDKLENWLISLSLEELADILAGLDDDDLAYIRQGLDMNYTLSQHGLAQGSGLGVGQALDRLVHQGLLHRDMALQAQILTAAGIDARMGGVMLPAMTLAGSGNQGIAAGMPLIAAAAYAAIPDQQRVLRAVTLSYLVTCALKAHTGRLSAMCGSGVAAGAGVAAGVAYLLDGGLEAIGGAVLNHLETVGLLICDGAKTSCALKVGESVGAAVRNALLALRGVAARPGDGFIGVSHAETLHHFGRLAREGLAGMDETILDIMGASGKL
jgi:L-cysteine desulfidase